MCNIPADSADMICYQENRPFRLRLRSGCHRRNGMKRELFKAYVLFLALLIPVLLSACVSGGGSVGGIVIDRPAYTFDSDVSGEVIYDGKGIPGVAIRVMDHDIETTTDDKGSFSFHIQTVRVVGIRKVRLQIELTKEGYRRRTLGIYIKQGVSNDHRILLLPERPKRR